MKDSEVRVDIRAWMRTKEICLHGSRVGGRDSKVSRPPYSF